MFDPDDKSKPWIVPSLPTDPSQPASAPSPYSATPAAGPTGAAAGPAAGSPAVAPAREVLLTETFEIPSGIGVDVMIRLAARMANFLNLLVAESLRSRNVTAAQPMPMAFLNASAAIESGALQQRQYLAQMAAMQGGGFVGPGGGPGGPPPGGFRMN